MNSVLSSKLKITAGLIVLMLLTLLVLIESASAVGITPGRTTMDYQPGGEREIEFTVINSESSTVNLVVLVQGELNESVSVSEVSFSLAGGESRTLKYKIEMPQGLSPGLHESEVVVIQLPGKSPTGEAFIGASIGVATQIHVFVPFPGKYAEVDMNVVGPEDNKITFVIPVHSRGDLDLVRVRGGIDIYTPLNEKVASVSTNEVSIFSQERKEIVAVWDVSAVPPGPYRAVATVLYDEDSTTVEKHFSVGDRLLEVQGIEVNGFSLGEIAKFEVLVENKWSQTIVGAFAQMLVYNAEGAVMADFKSATEDIPSLEKKLIIAFWDTAGVREGNYDASLFLKYGQTSEQQDLELEVKSNEINVIGVGYVISQERGGGLGGNTLTIVLVTAIVVLVLINLIWFLVLRKKLSRKR